MAGARFTNLTDAIEPRDGAEPRVGDDKRQGIHRLFGTTEFCNVWCVSFLCCGSTGTGGNSSEDPCGWRRWCVPLNALGHSGVDRDSIPAARGLLQRLKLHVDPILRRRGWRVKHLHEHNGRGPGGMCYHDLQGTADISIRLRAVAGACLRKPCQG